MFNTRRRNGDFDPNGLMEMQEEVARDTDLRQDGEDFTFVEKFVGRIDPHSHYKGWHAGVRMGSSCLFLTMFVLSICFVADTGVQYHTKFDLTTDFLTTGVPPARVVSQINPGHDQTFTVAAFLLTLTTVQIASGVFAYLTSVLSVWMVKYSGDSDESANGFLGTFMTASQYLFSTPSETDTSMWLCFEDMIVTPFIWVGFMMMFGERNIFFLCTIGFLALARGFMFFAADASNAYDHVDESLDVENDTSGWFGRTLRLGRRLHLSGLFGAFTITILGWFVLWFYAMKFPADERPAYYLGSFITVFILEVLIIVFVPSLYYGLLIRWGRFYNTQEYVVAMDTDRYNIIRLILYVARITVFFFLLRWGDTGHEFLPRWGFA
jgi:hypothetical protein